MRLDLVSIISLNPLITLLVSLEVLVPAGSRSSSLRLDILDTVPQHPDKQGLGLLDVELAFELRRVAADSVAMRPRARMAFPVFCYFKAITHTQNMQFKIHTNSHAMFVKTVTVTILTYFVIIHDHQSPK
jgi:hypothetical protein